MSVYCSFFSSIFKGSKKETITKSEAIKPLEKKKDSRIDAKKMEPRTYFKTQNERNGGDYGNNDRYTT